MASLRPTEQTLKHAWYDTAKTGIKPSGNCHIIVIGVGKVGNNTITRLIGSGLVGAKCITVETDVLHLNASRTQGNILIGEESTKNLRVEGYPKLSRTAIQESKKHVEDLLADADIVFITASLEGGNAKEAAPAIANIAKEKGAVTLGIVTTPLHTEEGQAKNATSALTEMRKQCNTIIVIDNNKLIRLEPQLLPNEAFTVADQVLANIIKSIIETISVPSLINLNVADFKTIVKHGGMATVGFGKSKAPNRAEEAVRNALSNPILDVDYVHATGALIHIAGDNMTIEEANRVGKMVTEMVSDRASVIWGAKANPELDGTLEVTLMMTGVESPHLPSRTRTIAPQLFNLEPQAGFEGQLDVKLGLYQMENFQ